MPKTRNEHLIYTINEWENSEHSIFFLNMLSIIFKNNDIKVIYDIGANVGGTAIVFLNYATEKQKNVDKIYCFEPEKENYKSMCENIKKYGYENKCVCNEYGIFYGKKESKIYSIYWDSEVCVDGGNNCGGYICDEEIAKKSAENLEGSRYIGESYIDDSDKNIIKLDELENFDLPDPDFIKIDIEGSELNLIENSVLLKKAKYIFVEFLWKDIDKYDYFLKYLPEFEIINDEGNDILLRNVNYNY